VRHGVVDELVETPTLERGELRPRQALLTGNVREMRTARATSAMRRARSEGFIEVAPVLT
jgi:hypothetical protein